MPPEEEEGTGSGTCEERFEPAEAFATWEKLMVARMLWVIGVGVPLMDERRADGEGGEDDCSQRSSESAAAEGRERRMEKSDRFDKIFAGEFRRRELT